MHSLIRGSGMTSERTRDRLIERLREQGIRDPRVLERVRATPRHLFVDEALASRAYEDNPLPIGHGQTISQPYIVARMTETLLARAMPGKVLEVGTGSGYQTAVLAPLVTELWSVERIAALVQIARQRLRSLHLRNVHVRHGDGHVGWPQQAPYDAILVTAAPAKLPEGLLPQLHVGGLLIAPVGVRGAQQLITVTRTRSGYEQEILGHVSFVPLLAGLC